jgi:hypothetical protein
MVGKGVLMNNKILKKANLERWVVERTGGMRAGWQQCAVLRRLKKNDIKTL